MAYHWAHRLEMPNFLRVYTLKKKGNNFEVRLRDPIFLFNFESDSVLMLDAQNSSNLIVHPWRKGEKVFNVARRVRMHPSRSRYITLKYPKMRMMSSRVGGVH